MSLKDYIEFYKNPENKEDFNEITSITFDNFIKSIMPIIKKDIFETVCKSFSDTASQDNIKFANTAIYTTI